TSLLPVRNHRYVCRSGDESRQMIDLHNVGENMRTEIEQVQKKIKGYIRETPIIHLEEGIWRLDAHLTLKLELLQHAGSFKPRGAFNRVLSHAVTPATGVIAASGGNHGLAVAYVAQQLGYPAHIFVPQTCPTVKVERLRHY